MPKGLQRGKGKPFVKGEAKGRPKGVQNKLTRTVKDTVLAVFNDLQSDPRHNLLNFAKQNTRDFYQIAARLIPAEMTTKVDGYIKITFVRKNGHSSSPE